MSNKALKLIPIITNEAIDIVLDGNWNDELQYDRKDELRQVVYKLEVLQAKLDGFKYVVVRQCDGYNDVDSAHKTLTHVIKCPHFCGIDHDLIKQNVNKHIVNDRYLYEVDYLLDVLIKENE